MSEVVVPAHSTLPPERWRQASEADRSEVGAALLAYFMPDEGQRFVTNITVTGEVRADAASLTALGDQAVAELGTAAELVDRRAAGNDTAPALTQRVRFSAETETEHFDLEQIQVIIAVHDDDSLRSADGDARVGDEAGEPASRGALVYLLALTAPESGLQAAVGDFQDFVRSFRLGEE